MRVARRDRLVFLHIPKTAGTSMRHYLHGQYRCEEILPATNWNEFIAKRLQPAEYALFAGHFRFSYRAILPPGTKSLVILRDPVSRYISHVRHAHFAKDFDPLHYEIRNLSLADIIRHPKYSTAWGNVLTKWIAARADPSVVAAFLDKTLKDVPSTLETDVVEAERLARAKHHLQEIDVVGFTEDMDRLADELCTMMKFHPPSRFPVKNASVNVAIPERVSVEDRAIIARLNEEDVELCAYARQSIEARRRRRAIFALTERKQYNVPEIPFVLDLNDPMPGSGWHRPESEGGATWRWTDADTVASLQFARTFPPDTICTISFFDWLVPLHPAFELSVNGKARIFSLAQRKGGHQIRFVLSYAIATDYYDIRLRPLWQVAKNSGVGDSRDLGIAVSSIAFAPGSRF